MEEVAEALNEEWRGGKTRVHFVPEYYRASRDLFRGWLEEQGHAPESIGSHAGISDTSQLLAVAPEHIRIDERHLEELNGPRRIAQRHGDG